MTKPHPVPRDFRFIFLNDGLDPTTTLICLLPEPAMTIKRVQFYAEFQSTYRHVLSHGPGVYSLHLPMPVSVRQVGERPCGRTWFASPPFPKPETYFHRKIANEGVGAAVLALLTYAPSDQARVLFIRYKRTKQPVEVQRVTMSLHEALLLATDHVGVHATGQALLDFYGTLWEDHAHILDSSQHKAPPPKEEGSVTRTVRPRSRPGVPGLSV